MDPTAPSSRSVSVHFLIANASGLFGIGIFLYQMLRASSLDHVLFTAATSGLVAYLALAVGLAGSRYIIMQAPEPDPPDDVSETSADQTNTDTEGGDEQTPEPQAA